MANNEDTALATVADYRKLVESMVYGNLRAAGEICRLRCFAAEVPDVDLLDSIAKGIYDFLCDGDVFDQVMKTIIATDPKYVGRMIADQDEHITKSVIAVVMGEDEDDDSAFTTEQ